MAAVLFVGHGPTYVLPSPIFRLWKNTGATPEEVTGGAVAPAAKKNRMPRRGYCEDTPEKSAASKPCVRRYHHISSLSLSLHIPQILFCLP